MQAPGRAAAVGTDHHEKGMPTGNLLAKGQGKLMSMHMGGSIFIEDREGRPMGPSQ
jgi:hypothetical protein